MSDLTAACLYGILDLGYVAPEDMPDMAHRMINGGVDIIQLRAKGLPTEAFAKLAEKLAPIVTEAGVPFILNDHPELVNACGATGAHVGQEDMTVTDARRLAGPGAIIGKSTHSLEQAIAAQHAAADYIGYGPLFPTPTKPEYTAVGLDEIRRIHDTVKIPIFCIGGVKLENLRQVLDAGAKRVVIVSGLLQAPDLVTYAREVRKLLS